MESGTNFYLIELEQNLPLNISYKLLLVNKNELILCEKHCL